jgi:riboflavin kinase/FMN adenylyltransferase
MEIMRSYRGLTDARRGCVAAIGNFDGIHLGHQAVLGQLAEIAAVHRLPAVVITFEPHPQEFFQEFFGRGIAPPRLTCFREKMIVLRRFAVDQVLCLRFDAKLARMDATEFVERVLVHGLGVRSLVVGDDFRFGRNRLGDRALLQDLGRQHGFELVGMHNFDIDGQRVSSTRIRAALAGGDLRAAERLLGRPYRMSGRIVLGDQRGRTIGFPTANVHRHRLIGREHADLESSPLRGVFAVEVFGLEHAPYRAVANVGVRPTIDGEKHLLEVHLLDFDGDIYGRHVQVAFLAKLRDERRFESLEALRTQITRDVLKAREIFAGDPGAQKHVLLASN